MRPSIPLIETRPSMPSNPARRYAERGPYVNLVLEISTGSTRPAEGLQRTPNLPRPQEAGESVISTKPTFRWLRRNGFHRRTMDPRWSPLTSLTLRLAHLTSGQASFLMNRVARTFTRRNPPGLSQQVVGSSPSWRFTMGLIQTYSQHINHPRQFLHCFPPRRMAKLHGLQVALHSTVPSSESTFSNMILFEAPSRGAILASCKPRLSSVDSPA
jgi:hypothetical protein